MVTKIAVGPRGSGEPLTVDERCPDVIVLFYVRHAWGLGDRQVPMADPAPDTTRVRALTPENSSLWDERWWSVWKSFHRYGAMRDRFGSTWQDRFGSAGIDIDAVHRWRDALTTWPPPPLRWAPEWLAREAVRAAQARGLTRILIVPSSQPWFETRDHGVLLVSRTLRTEPSAFQEAIDAFGR